MSERAEQPDVDPPSSPEAPVVVSDSERPVGAHSAGGSELTEPMPALDDDSPHGESSDLFEQAVRGAIDDAFDSAFIPQQIGPYRILGPLGRGGMGAVLKAEQRSPIRRLVAIKIVKPGFDTREVIARFNAERQVLARMDHPNIAKVLDAGATDAGRPYFVMEFVPGKPITDFCDANRLSIPERLALFRQACDAIGHAHTKGVIHRDIKAYNVLAYQQDNRPTVKVIDFGVAKALAGDSTPSGDEPADSFYTAMHSPIGTYDTMSPEQAEGSPDIDTRADVYSLGVLLYELLCGATLFDRESFAKLPAAEKQRLIREVEPPRPSVRVGQYPPETLQTIAARRELRATELATRLRRELEWIPLKAIRKERGRRYGSVGELAEDISRFLDRKPLRAGPESQSYRVRKYLTRNRGPVAAIASVFVALALGFAGTSIGLIRAAAQRDEAQRQRETAERTVRFMVDMFDSAKPEVSQQKDVSALWIVQRAVKDVQERWRDEPEVMARLQNTLARVLFALGRHAEAEPLFRDAYHNRRVSLGDDHPDTIESEVDLAAFLRQTDRAEDALALSRDALDRSTRANGPEHALTLDAMNNYGSALAELNRFVDARPILKTVLDRRRRILGPDDPLTLTTSSNYASVLESLEMYDEAEKLYRDVLDSRARKLGPGHRATLTARGNLAYLLDQRGRKAEAETLYRSVVVGRKSLLGDDHPDTLNAVRNHVLLLQEMSRLPEAEAECRQSLLVAAQSGSLGPKHEKTLILADLCAQLIEAQGRGSEAAALRQQYGIGSASEPAPTSQPGR